MSAAEESIVPPSSTVPLCFQEEGLSVIDPSFDTDTISVVTLKFPLHLDPVSPAEESTDTKTVEDLKENSFIRCICTSKNFASKKKNWEYKGNTKVSTKFFGDWEDHWSRIGKQIVWETWFEKYQEYINPNYDILQLQKDKPVLTDEEKEKSEDKKEKKFTPSGFEVLYDDEEGVSDSESKGKDGNSVKKDTEPDLTFKEVQDSRWQEAWEEHTQQVYWQEYSKFYIDYQPVKDLASQLDNLSLNPEDQVQVERTKLEFFDIFEEEEAVKAFLQYGLYFKGNYYYDGSFVMPNKYLANSSETNEKSASPSKVAMYLNDFIANEAQSNKKKSSVYSGKRRRFKNDSVSGVDDQDGPDSDVYYEAMEEESDVKTEQLKIEGGVAVVSLPNKRRANTHIRFRYTEDLEENLGNETEKISEKDADRHESEDAGADEDEYQSAGSDVNLESNTENESENSTVKTDKKLQKSKNKANEEGEESSDWIDNWEGSTDEDVEKHAVVKPIKRKKKKKKNKKRSDKYLSVRACPDFMDFRCDLRKYWKQRYKLFSKYDEGIMLDQDSWFSVTPENIAAHIADRCKNFEVIIDAFCGCGGNTIQFAKKCTKVIAIDIDPVKVEFARNNAKIYGVEDKIEFIVGDFMKLAADLVGDVVFLSPPWGGPSYLEAAPVFDLETMIPMNGLKLFNLAQTISKNIGYFVPRNVDLNQLAILAGPGNSVEIQKNLDDKKIKAITAYYGDLVWKRKDDLP